MFGLILEVVLFWAGIFVLALVWDIIRKSCGYKPKLKSRPKHLTEEDYRRIQASL